MAISKHIFSCDNFGILSDMSAFLTLLGVEFVFDEDSPEGFNLEFEATPKQIKHINEYAGVNYYHCGDPCEARKLSDVKKGDFFKLSPNAKAVYVRDDYDRSTRKYCAYKYEDFNAWRLLKGDSVVFVNFTY